MPASSLPDVGVGDASALSPTDAWVVGSTSNDDPVIEHWDGTSWTAQQLPPLESPQFSDVEAIAPDDVWVMGYTADSDGLFLHWNGHHWRIVKSPQFGGKDFILREMSAAGTADVWAVGLHSGSTGPRQDHSLAEHWDGRRWSVVPTPRTRKTIWTQYELVSAVSFNDVWVVGFTYNVPEQVGHRFVTHWDGTSWSRSHGVLAPATRNEITAIGPDDVWIVESMGTQSLMQHWNGEAWSTVSTPGPGISSTVYALDGPSPTDLWGVGTVKVGEHPDTNEPMILHWDGAAWTQVPVSGERGHKDLLSVIAADTADDAWTFGGTGTHLIGRHWDGQSWS